MIVRQDLLDEDDMRTSSMPKMLAGKDSTSHQSLAGDILCLILASIEKKQQIMMKRRDTRMSFDESRDALKRFESTVATPTQVFEEADDDSQDDEGQ